MKLIWNNSYMYNMKGSDIYLMTREMVKKKSKFFFILVFINLY